MIPAATAPDREAFDLTEAARISSLSRRTLERLIKDGQGPPVFRIGGRVRVTRAALVAWLESLQASGGTPGRAAP